MSTFAGWIALVALGLMAGASFVTQQAVNSSLRSSLGSPLWAAFVSYAGGTLCVAVLLLVSRQPWMTLSGESNTPWLSWTGGAFGLVYVLAAITLLPKVGAATTLALIVAGQMLASIAFDHFGLFGLPRHSVNISRAAGAILLLAGVMLVRR